MPYDPTKPANNSPLSSAEMRSQFTGLQDNLTAATQDKVSFSQLNTELSAAISSTAMNPASMGPMSISFSDPPTQGELLQVQAYINDLRNALYRAP